HVALDLHHVLRGDAVGDADAEFYPRIRRLHDRIGGKGRRHEDDAGLGAGLAHRAFHRVEDGQAEMRLAALAGGDAADQLGAVALHVLGMEAADLAGEALDDDACAAVEQDCHFSTSLRLLSSSWWPGARRRRRYRRT